MIMSETGMIISGEGMIISGAGMIMSGTSVIMSVQGKIRSGCRHKCDNHDRCRRGAEMQKRKRNMLQV